MGTGLWTKGSGKSKTGGVASVHRTAERLVVLQARPPEPAMSLPRTVAEVIDHQVTLELESLDRVYLNVYQPQLGRNGPSTMPGSSARVGSWRTVPRCRSWAITPHDGSWTSRSPPRLRLLRGGVPGGDRPVPRGRATGVGLA